jgi:hypothetical protein
MITAIKSNSMASTVSHAENCLYEIKEAIVKNGSPDQRELLEKALTNMESLYFSLREDE